MSIASLTPSQVRAIGAQVSSESFHTAIMGPLSANEDLYAIEAHVYTPYGWGMDWKCGKECGDCDIIGGIGTGNSTDKAMICDPRTGSLISRAIYDVVYNHVSPTPAQINEIEHLSNAHKDASESAKNGFGPWVITEDFYANTGCCGTTGSCNGGACGSVSSECGKCNNNKYAPNMFNILITKINISNPYLSNGSNLEYALQINGIQARTIILNRGIRYYFFNKVSIAGVDNCDLPEEFAATFICFSRIPISRPFNELPIINNTVPMPVGEAFWLRVPLSWPGQSYLVTTNVKIAGTSIVTLAGTRAPQGPL